ncbi:MAG TPA: hypothetical protein VMY42_20610, partial [Thermoguttaceae bacterium]|nr:hypothetical protein [Thermoguttaceae bacterium]
MAASDAPTDWVFEGRPLRVAVETLPGSRQFELDPRIGVEKLVLGTNDTASMAVLNVFAGPIHSAAKGAEPALDIARVLNSESRPGFSRRFLSPEQEIMIFLDREASTFETGESEESGREILFSGYCPGPRYDERSAKTAAKAQTDRSFTLTVTSMLDRLSQTPQAQICGRRLRTAAGQDALDEAQARSDTTPQGEFADVVEVRSEPCTFNRGGRGNRAAAPITVTIGDEDYLIHIFAADNDPDAQTWTFAQALRYLVFFHMFESHACEGTIRDLPGPVRDGNVFSSTQDLATLSLDDRPGAPVAEADAYKYAMLGEPRELACDGLNLPEALILLADSAGARFRVKLESQTEADEAGNDYETGLPVNRLYFSARGAGPEKELHKEADFNDRGLDAADLVGKTNVKDLSISVDYSDIVSNPVFVGDVRRYEITAELVPGWKPNSHLDNVAEENVEDELEFAELHWYAGTPDELQSDPWYTYFHKAGGDFELYAHIGRCWVLNETGRYRADDYARTIGPFNADRYAPFEPSDCQITDRVIDDQGNPEVVDVETGAWVRKPRPLQPCFAADELKRSMGIWVDFSFDHGVHFHHIPEVRILNLGDEAGIYIDSDDLTKIVREKDEEGMHFWEAMLKGEARVRVTAVIDGD